MNKILITGASGFIGTNLLSSFVGQAEVLNLDLNPPKDSTQNRYWQAVDICNREAVCQDIMAFNPDYIIHLAARTDLDGIGLEDYRANVEGVENVLYAADQCPNLKKILITSSMLVCKVGYMPTSDLDYCPTTWYGRSKVKTEEIVYSHCPSCEYAILRPTSIWGPWFGVPYRNFFNMVSKRLYFHIGDNSCTKTYGYVENAVYQIRQILFTDTSQDSSKVYYIGDYEPVNIEEWANQIADQFGYSLPRFPYWIVQCAAKIGDWCTQLHIPSPMTSFRLKNMTTNNIIDLKHTKCIAPTLPVSRAEAIHTTLEWMKQH